MKYMGLNEIREAYLSFFESKGHLRLPSFSLIPKNDKSLLLINAGMAPMKAYFTGLKVPPRKRVTTCQKCVRTGDIENVGITSRHGTFFEMLGNFSFGDYFKKEVIPWAWEFITEKLELPKEKLYVTIYLDDDEAYNIWCNSTDVNPKHIFRLGKEDNFWEHGEGPCGPCSEIHFNKTEKEFKTKEEFVKAGDKDEAIELWNLVFTQFDKDEDGNYNRLSHPNIDTGMGLERMATVMQGVSSIFEADTIRNILDKVCEISGKKYGESKKDDISIRIVTDHIRSVTFMISDGILPSNEGRGYVLRRLLRRACRHGRLLGIKKLFLSDICDIVIKDSFKSYPELKEKESYIKKIIRMEEEKFDETIDSGMGILKEYIKELKESNKKVLSGDKTFKLYDTFGFPPDLTKEILNDYGFNIDMDGFKVEMEKQRKLARSAREHTNYMGIKDSVVNSIPVDVNTIFDGYDKIELNSKILYIIKNEEFCDEASEGDEAIVVTEKTPFYAEMGGQVGDTGVIYNDNFSGVINDCKKNISGKILHYVKINKGKIKKEEEVSLKVDKDRREKISANHTATHLLDKALKVVLGGHINQAGSYVDDERLRFDFTHFASVKKEEIKKVESIVNDEIMKAQDVRTDIMSLEKAKNSGAVALFDEKYSDEVRVVSVGDFSKELCGGTHVKNSGKIGLFKIISENGVASGVRRIEALTGLSAISYVNKKLDLLNYVQDEFKCSEKDIKNKLHAQFDEIKDKDKEISRLKGKLAGESEDKIIQNAVNVKGINVVAAELNNTDAATLRELGDKIREKVGNCIVVLGSNFEGKVNFVCMATKDAVKKGIHCGKIIKEVASIAGGSGGGRPDMAQAGGKNADKISEAIKDVEKIVGKML